MVSVLTWSAPGVIMCRNGSAISGVRRDKLTSAVRDFPVATLGWAMALQAAGLLEPVKVVLDATQAHATELCQFVCSESGLFLQQLQQGVLCSLSAGCWR